MIKGNYNRPKAGLKLNKFYKRQLNKVIVVLSILIIILLIKMINNSTSNNIIEIIERNIYYDFNWKNDGGRVAQYVRQVMGKTAESIEIFNVERKK